MNTIKITAIAIIPLIIAACNTSKKNSKLATTTPSPVVTATPTPTSAPTQSSFMVSRSPDGIYTPGNEELTAIQVQYKDVTMETLKKGHTLYTFGACARCHRAQSIYKYSESRWKEIIDDMAVKAEITGEEKDAVYKYVLSIKATQPK